MKQFSAKSQQGFTLVEMVVSIGIFAILSVIIGQVYFLIINSIVAYREQTTVSALANQYLEVARNLPYSQIGTLSGNPHGSLADMPNPITSSVNGINYQIYYVVNYVDDVADGTIVAGTDFAPNDYKQIKLYVKNTRTNYTNSFLTNISPKGLEGLASGGAVMIRVFDAVGQPVSGASIRIQNTVLNPPIDLTRSSDANGNWVEVGLPNSANSYHITVTKNSYSSDQTYPVSGQNPNPVKPDATIANGQVTQISFSIDRLSNLIFNMQSNICAPLANVGFAVQGAKLIGTPNVLKFDHTYSSDINGQIALTNIEWDSYTPALTGSTYMIYGSSPIQQASILPNTTQTFNLILGPKTNHSLLVIVKDASTSNPIEGAEVVLTSASTDFNDSRITEGSIWSQQDWSGGSGQEDFIDATKYFSDNGNIDNSGNPSGIRLATFNGTFVNSASLISSAFDTGTSGSSYTTLSWQPTSQDPATSIKFQLATNNDNTTWDFVGPDGTSASYYIVPGTSINAGHDNNRYVRYKVFLSTTDSTKSPVLTSVNMNYVSGCPTPGQAMFAGLSPGEDYQAVVSATGYQTQTIPGLAIDGYNVLEVLMNQ